MEKNKTQKTRKYYSAKTMLRWYYGNMTLNEQLKFNAAIQGDAVEDMGGLDNEP